KTFLNSRSLRRPTGTNTQGNRRCMSESSEPPSNPPATDSKEKRSSKRLGRISARTGKPIADSGTLRLAAMPAPNDDVFHAAERSAEFFDHLRAHYRKSRRAPVNIG